MINNEANKVYKAWCQLINKNIVNSDSVRKEIYQSWIRSRYFNVDPHNHYLLKSNEEKLNITAEVRAQHPLMLKSNLYTLLLNEEYRVLSRYSCIDSNMMILDNIVNFSEDKVGTTAASLADKDSVIYSVVEEEHYNCNFHSFTSICVRFDMPLQKFSVRDQHNLDERGKNKACELKNAETASKNIYYMLIFYNKHILDTTEYNNLKFLNNLFMDLYSNYCTCIENSNQNLVDKHMGFREDKSPQIQLKDATMNTVSGVHYEDCISRMYSVMENIVIFANLNSLASVMMNLSSLSTNFLERSLHLISSYDSFKLIIKTLASKACIDRPFTIIVNSSYDHNIVSLLSKLDTYTYSETNFECFSECKIYTLKKDIKSDVLLSMLSSHKEKTICKRDSSRIISEVEVTSSASVNDQKGSQVSTISKELTKKSTSDNNKSSYGQLLVESEIRSIVETLEATDGNKVLTSRRLGISRSTLYRKIKEYNLDNN